MTSPLPPKRRDSRNLADLIRQDRTRLAQLDRGLVGGRFSPARPLKPRWDDDAEDDSADGDTDIPAAQNTDTATASAAGQITLNLTYVPIDGTLLIFWDGQDLLPTEYVLAGQRVTFTDRHIKVGSRLHAAYWYWPSDVPGAPGPATMVARTGVSAWGTASSSGGSGPPIPLPAGTVVGDLIVLSVTSTGAITVTDPRLTFVGNGTWLGWATDLTNISVGLVTAWYAITCDTFATNATGWTSASLTSNPSANVGDSIAVPSIPGVAATICAVTAGISGFGSCSISTPSGYVSEVYTTNPLSSAINLWTDTSLSGSPATTVTYSGGGPGSIYATTIGLIGPAD